jgi:hypothetical protein
MGAGQARQRLLVACPLSSLFDVPQEDKIAGMNVLRHCLGKGGLAPQWASELRALEELYASGHVFAWWVFCLLPACLSRPWLASLG